MEKPRRKRNPFPHLKEIAKEIQSIAVENLSVLNKLYNYNISKEHIEERARNLASAIPILFRVRFHPDDPAKPTRKKSSDKPKHSSLN